MCLMESAWSQSSGRRLALADLRVLVDEVRQLQQGPGYVAFLGDDAVDTLGNGRPVNVMKDRDDEVVRVKRRILEFWAPCSSVSFRIKIINVK